MRAPLALLLLVSLPLPLDARQDWDAIPVEATHIRGSVFAIFGTGANQAISTGTDGLLVVDAGYEELGDRLLGVIRSLDGNSWDRGRTYLLDTHWHFDHTGANAIYAQAGATVLAHEQTASLLAEDQTMPALGDLEVAAAVPSARPALVFSSRLELWLNGGVVDIIHAPGAHTAGDAVVHFRDADVMHLGDLFFNGMYPFIDVDHGGSLEGLVSALDELLSSTTDSTLFIPGHGPLGDRADLEGYTEMLRTVHQRVSAMIGRGFTRLQVIESRPTADLDSVWSRSGGFTEPDVWVGLVYDGYAVGGVPRLLQCLPWNTSPSTPLARSTPTGGTSSAPRSRTGASTRRSSALRKCTNGPTPWVKTSSAISLVPCIGI
jgi:cyclase